MQRRLFKKKKDAQLLLHYTLFSLCCLLNLFDSLIVVRRWLRIYIGMFVYVDHLHAACCCRSLCLWQGNLFLLFFMRVNFPQSAFFRACVCVWMSVGWFACVFNLPLLDSHRPLYATVRLCWRRPCSLLSTFGSPLAREREKIYIVVLLVLLICTVGVYIKEKRINKSHICPPFSFVGCECVSFLVDFGPWKHHTNCFWSQEFRAAFREARGRACGV